MAAIRFTLVTGAQFLLTVDDPSSGIHEFAQGESSKGLGSPAQPLRGAWIAVDNGAMIARAAVVAVEPVSDSEPQVASR